MICCICNSSMRFSFVAKILRKYSVSMFHCDDCGYICSEKPYWLSEAYEDSIVLSDTGIMARNIDISRRIASFLYFCVGNRGNGPWLDCAGGYGIFTRIMRDYGFDFYWSDKYSKNIVARGFDAPLGEKYSGITAIEAIEHTENPKIFVGDALASTGADFFVFTTETYEGSPPSPEDWWYYGFHSGQHISFFQVRTLRRLAKVFGFYYTSASNFHIFSRYPLSRLMVKFATGKVSGIAQFLIRRRLESKVVSDRLKMIGD